MNWFTGHSRSLEEVACLRVNEQFVTDFVQHETYFLHNYSSNGSSSNIYPKVFLALFYEENAYLIKKRSA